MRKNNEFNNKKLEKIYQKNWDILAKKRKSVKMEQLTFDKGW